MTPFGHPQSPSATGVPCRTRLIPPLFVRHRGHRTLTGVGGHDRRRRATRTLSRAVLAVVRTRATTHSPLQPAPHAGEFDWLPPIAPAPPAPRTAPSGSSPRPHRTAPSC